jgi:hypothetical protein
MIADFPKHVFDLLQQQLATTGRIGATRYFLTPNVASPAAAGGISTPVSIRFTQKGIALAMYGQETATATAALYAQTAFRCQIGGTEDLFVDGQGGPAFLPMLAAFGGVNNWTPLLRRVTPGVDWTFTFRNDTAAGAIVPRIVIAVIADADVASMAEKGQGR